MPKRRAAVAAALRLCAVLAVLAAVLTVTFSAAPAAAQSAGGVPEIARQILSDSRFQKDLPTTDAKFDGDAGPDLDLGTLPELPKAVVAVGKVLFWAIVIAIAAILLFYLVNEVPRLMRARQAKQVEPAESAGDWDGDIAASAGPPPDLDQADRLAREGRYVEAVHVLLLNGMRELRGRLGGALAPSLTSREVLRRVPMPDPARAALTSIVGAVERGHFGGRDLGADDYDRCRAQFLAFAETASEGA